MPKAREPTTNEQQEQQQLFEQQQHGKRENAVRNTMQVDPEGVAIKRRKIIHESSRENRVIMIRGSKSEYNRFEI